MVWCNPTSDLPSWFYIYCPVEIWDEWNVELVITLRPALTGVAAAADAVRHNCDGDGVLMVGWSHVIRRCLDFMGWLGKAESPEDFFIFSRYLIEGGTPLLQFELTSSMVPSFTLVSMIQFLV